MWQGDNRRVFDFLKEKTFGTTAWHTIKVFEREEEAEKPLSFDCPLSRIGCDGTTYEGG